MQESSSLKQLNKLNAHKHQQGGKLWHSENGKF